MSDREILDRRNAVIDATERLREQYEHIAIEIPPGRDPPRAARRGPRAREERAKTLVGRWRIVEMDLWDLDAIDLVAPGFIEFGKDDTGGFGFIAVQGWTDCRHGERDGRPFVEFTWEGWDEGDQVSGRGWAAGEEDGSLRGHIYFHLGDDSGFRAVRADESKGTGTRAVRETP